ncbi:Uncharacterised protein [Mycobacteroides abscessus subsp. abscessus]|nr:Uncharacterised protein [Mycobacteroides abscessus subsp. abscessus]
MPARGPQTAARTVALAAAVLSLGLAAGCTKSIDPASPSKDGSAGPASGVVCSSINPDSASPPRPPKGPTSGPAGT